MTLFDWLTSPAGNELTNAVALVLVALAGYLSYLAKRTSEQNQTKLDGHLEQHKQDIVVARTADAIASRLTPPPNPPQ